MISLSEAYTHSGGLTLPEFIWHDGSITSPRVTEICVGASAAAVWMLYIRSPDG